MAFENVNVESLRSSINACKNSIQYSTSKELIGSISNNNVWQADAKRNLSDALEQLTEVRYKELVNKLDGFMNATNMIAEYKELDVENKSLERQYASLQGRLYKTERYTTSYTDSKGRRHTSTETRQVIDRGVQSQMSSIRNRINANKRKMDLLHNKVASIV